MNRTRITPALWILLLATLLVTIASHGSDIQRGITFQDGQRLTAAQLHQLIDNATIVPGFVINKPNTTSLESGAVFLIYSPSAQALEKISASAALYGNTALITDQGEKASPSGNDYLLLYDTGGGVMAKTAISSIWSNNIASLPSVVASNISLVAQIPILNNGTNASTTLSNIFLLFPYTALFTNLPVRLTPTNFDEVLLSASDDGTNYFTRQVSLPGLITNLPPASVLTNAAATNDLSWSTNVSFFAYQERWTTNGILTRKIVRFELGQIQTLFTNIFAITSSVPTKFVSAEIPITNDVMYLDFPHGLPGTPQVTRAVLVCKTAEASYLAGDEIVFDTGVKDSADGKYGTYGQSSTNLFFNFRINGRIQVPDKVSGSLTSLAGAHSAVVTNWKLKFYATYFP